MDESAIPPLLGVIGHPIAGNPMQFAMEKALDAAGLEWRFLSFDVVPERLSEAVRGIDSLGFRGVSISPPHCSAAFGLVDEHTPTAQTARWVDALSRAPSGNLLGQNLVGEAFVDLLGPASLSGATVALLGDCAKSVALSATLLQHGVAAMRMRDTDPARFADQSTGTEFHRSPLSDEADLEDLAVLIRGKQSSSGAAAEFSEAQIDRLAPQCVVVDLAECAGTSPLLRFAAGRNLRGVSVIDLLVARAALAFRVWTGASADTTQLREAFEEYLEI